GVPARNQPSVGSRADEDEPADGSGECEVIGLAGSRRRPDRRLRLSAERRLDVPSFPRKRSSAMICQLFLVVTTLGAFSPNTPETAVAKVTKAGLEQEVADISGYYTCRGLETGGK